MRLLLLGLLLLGLLAAPSAALTPGPLIAFTGLTSTQPDVVTVTPDAADVRNLTPGEQNSYTADSNPSWSPDGMRVAFASHRDSNLAIEVYVMNVDGTGQTRLTHDSGQNDVFNTLPLWSPRGDLIAFEKQRGQSIDLWVMHPDGSGQRALTTDGGIKTSVSWSPDGAALVYVRSASSGARISIVGLSGAPPVALDPPGSSDFDPAWSPDGSTIAFSAPALTLMAADGSNRRTLTEIGTSSPAWSRDGSRIAFTGIRRFPQYGSRLGIPSRQDVFVIDASGAHLRRLTGPFADDLFEGAGGTRPTWWPDGSRLFYVSQRYPGAETTFQLNADGTCEGRFASPPVVLRDPAWRPGPLSLPGPLTCAELRIRGSAAKYQLALRETTRFHVVVDNDGNEAAADARIVITPGAGVDLDRGSLTGCEVSASTTTCPIGRIGPGGSTELGVDVRRATPGPLFVDFHVAAAEPDTDTTNNDVRVGADVLACTVVGSYGADYLVGTAKADRICALPGADIVYGGRGNDVIDAGNGDDRIYPGPGRDTVIAKGGGDVVYARDGDRDWIDCGAQVDVAVVDRSDVVRHCEYVSRPPRGRPGSKIREKRKLRRGIR